jgi:hypothetical protein
MESKTDNSGDKSPAIVNEIQPQLIELLENSDNIAAMENGVWSVLKNCADLIGGSEDVRAVIDEVVNNTRVKVWEQADSFLSKGTAKLSTRLFGAAKWQAKAWKTETLRHQQRYVELVSDAWIEARYESGKSSAYVEPIQCGEGPELTLKMLCPHGCGLQLVASAAATTYHLECGHSRELAA